MLAYYCIVTSYLRQCSKGRLDNVSIYTLTGKDSNRTAKMHVVISYVSI